MDRKSYILFPGKNLCQGKMFKKHAQLSASPPLTPFGEETFEIIAINCSSLEQIPVTVNEIASMALELPLTDENLSNALWSDTCSRHMLFKPYGDAKPDYLDEMLEEKNIPLKSTSCIYIPFEKETLDIVSKFTANKLRKNL
jgi:hypothetical protein